MHGPACTGAAQVQYPASADGLRAAVPLDRRLVIVDGSAAQDEDVTTMAQFAVGLGEHEGMFPFTNRASARRAGAYPSDIFWSGNRKATKYMQDCSEGVENVKPGPFRESLCCIMFQRRLFARAVLGALTS